MLTILIAPDGFSAQQRRELGRLLSIIRRARPSRPAKPVAPLASLAREPRDGSVLEVSDVRVAFGGTLAADGVSLTVRPGEVVGLIGPNGAGKTTMIDVITGYVRLRSGRLVLGGKDVTGFSPARIARAGVTRSFQSLELFEDMTVLDNLRVACDPRDPWSYLLDMIWPRKLALTTTAAAAVRDFGLESELLKKPQDVSYGTRRLVGIARAVATGANVLLLDEPAAGLSDQETAELGRLVRSMADEWQVAVLIVEHNVELIMDICDDVYVLNFGRVISHGPARAVREDPAVVQAYLGESADAQGSAPSSVSL